MTPQRLRNLFHYDPATGVFTRRVGVRGSRAGEVVGCENKQGYVRFMVDGKQYLAHRLAWLYMRGKWPADQIDHINHVCNDNRIENLRPATNAENQLNRKHAPAMKENVNRPLKVFLHYLTLEQQKQFARIAGTSLGALRHLVTGRRVASSAMAIALEKAAVKVVGPGLLKRGDLSPTCRGCEHYRACTGRQPRLD